MNRDLLLIFIRVRKYDLNRSVKLVTCASNFVFNCLQLRWVFFQVKNYLKLLKNSPNLTGDLKPQSLKNAVKQNIIFLNRNRDTHGRRIIFSQIGKGSTSYSNLVAN